MQNTTPKLAEQNPENIFQEAIYNGVSKMLLKCHSQYNKGIRLLQYSSANSYGGNWGCIVLDLETIIVLVFLAFNFIPQMSHHLLTLSRPLIRDSATVTPSPNWKKLRGVHEKQ